MIGCSALAVDFAVFAALSDAKFTNAVATAAVLTFVLTPSFQANLLLGASAVFLAGVAILVGVACSISAVSYALVLDAPFVSAAGAVCAAVSAVFAWVAGAVGAVSHALAAPAFLSFWAATIGAVGAVFTWVANLVSTDPCALALKTCLSGRASAVAWATFAVFPALGVTGSVAAVFAGAVVAFAQPFVTQYGFVAHAAFFAVGIVCTEAYLGVSERKADPLLGAL